MSYMTIASVKEHLPKNVQLDNIKPVQVNGTDLVATTDVADAFKKNASQKEWFDFQVRMASNPK